MNKNQMQRLNKGLYDISVRHYTTLVDFLKYEGDLALCPMCGHIDLEDNFIDACEDEFDWACPCCRFISPYVEERRDLIRAPHNDG